MLRGLWNFKISMGLYAAYRPGDLFEALPEMREELEIVGCQLLVPALT